ncbi:hypothetical protein M5G27_25210 [Pseudomonas shahriarae]|uniref:Lipoprotein n=1 Tax=Pseudomonas shahriarae TaxID=2745512 RepID=A0A9X4C5S3_9PSED|nr:hypothetical protein [Pseudomonas shahriarae]MDD1010780.1 hypothetical protein [Pseudomonas shahriarae]
MLHRYSRLWLPVLILTAFLGGCEPDSRAPKLSASKPTAAALDEAKLCGFWSANASPYIVFSRRLTLP